MKFLFLLSLLVFSCQGSGDLDSNPSKNDTGVDGLSNQNDVSYSDMEGSISGCGIQEMYESLEPTCANCHRGGTTPYFASSTAFYRLLLADENWVVAGKPEESALVDLLIGEAKGQYKQMPLGKKSYEDLAKENIELTSMDEIRTFITEFETCTPSEPLPSERNLVRRKNARQIFNSLKLHIGLEDEDLRNGGEATYPLWSPDDVIPFSDGVNVDGFSSPAAQRWHAFGGESYLKNIRATSGFTPTFGQTIVQVSQAWCRKGLEKSGNQRFFRHVDQENLASASDEEIKQNIKYQMLRFWGHVASDEEVDAMFSEIYASYSSAENPQTAWVAVCSSLIRDPLWLVY